VSFAGGYDAYAFVADFYDHVVPYRSRPDVTFFVDAARESGGRVLEVGCGTGRILIPTARAAVDVMGLDFSTHMLTVCRARLAQEPEAVRARVELAHGDTCAGHGSAGTISKAFIPSGSMPCWPRRHGWPSWSSTPVCWRSSTSS
jgi:SAM-dependent methyltransferase